jgi:anti-anti-sigma regulatory factor
MSATGFLDMDAVGALVRMARTLKCQGRQLVLHRPPPSLRRIAGIFPGECSAMEVAA